MPRPVTTGLTPFQIDVLDFMEDFYREKQYPPTLREICDGIGSSSTSAVRYAQVQLARNGYVSAGEQGESRTIVPTFKARGKFNDEPYHKREYKV